MRREHYVRNHLVSVRMGDKLNYTIPASPTYGNPTKPLEYQEPLPADGDRTPSVKSPFNYRGNLVCDNDNRNSPPRVLSFESSVEKNAALILQTRRDIAKLEVQQPTVAWVSSDGEVRKHTFDLLATMDNGDRVAIAAKPTHLLLENDLIGTLIRISRHHLDGKADRVSFVTERFANDNDAYNASEILLSRRLRNEEEYLIAWSLLKKLAGPVRFRALFAGAEIPAHRRTALWCLIDDQLLRPVSPGTRVEDDTLMIATI